MVYVNLKGGLGNQMFQYASAKAFCLKFNEKLVIDLSNITNLDHNVYTLDKFNIDCNGTVDHYCSLQKNISRIISSISYRSGKKFNYVFSYKLEKIINFIANPFGIYSVENGYMQFKKAITKNKYISGYLQSSKYFSDYSDSIKKEFQVKSNVFPQNVKLLENIKKSNSVCVHIRRGDYVKLKSIVCSLKYYENAVQYFNDNLKKPKFFIFSNEIEWVKKNLTFPCKVKYITNNNPNYEELRLMYSCKHFIISNSTFSWWAQYLSDNKEKKVIAPFKWFVDGQKEDMYEENWLIFNNKGRMIKPQKF